MAIRVTAPVRIDISAGWPDSDPYRKDFGGAVLNAAIGMRVKTTFEEEFESSYWQAKGFHGLGASGAVDATILTARNPKLAEDKLDLIRKVWNLENNVVCHRAGLQDQAAAIYGGVNLWEFGSGQGENASIRRTQVPVEKAKHLQNHLVLVNIGRSTLSSNIHDLVFGARNYQRNIPTLDRMKAIAFEMFQYINNESEMINLIVETWNLQKSLHKSVENPSTRVLEQLLKSRFEDFALRETGSGGCALIYTSCREGVIRYITSLKEEEKLQKEIKIIPFNFEYYGIRVEKS